MMLGRTIPFWDFCLLWMEHTREPQQDDKMLVTKKSESKDTLPPHLWKGSKTHHWFISTAPLPNK